MKMPNQRKRLNSEISEDTTTATTNDSNKKECIVNQFTLLPLDVFKFLMCSLEFQDRKTICNTSKLMRQLFLESGSLVHMTIINPVPGSWYYGGMKSVLMTEYDYTGPSPIDKLPNPTGVPIDTLPNGLTALSLWIPPQSIDKLPTSLTQLVFGRRWEGVPIDQLPPKLTHLTLADTFNEELDELPSTLTQLNTGHMFNKGVGMLPPKLTKLTLGHSFNRGIVAVLPNKLTELTIGDNFNMRVDKLPSTLTHLTLGDKFNHRVDNLPRRLTHLTLGKGFQKSLDRLPSTLTHLVLHNDSVIPATLPPSLKYLKRGDFQQYFEVIN
jgi:hypothetical protein